jgi:hypothetical protein
MQADYQVKVVLDGEFAKTIKWSEPMTWEQVISSFKKAYHVHNGDRMVLVGVKNLNDGRWIVDRMNPVSIGLVDEEMTCLMVKRVELNI